MRACMRADGTTFPPRFDLIETAGHDDKEGSFFGPHTAGSDVETTVETATGELLVGLWPKFLTDLVQQG